MMKRKEGGYKITKEMIHILMKLPKDQQITTMDFDNSRGILKVFVTGESCPEIYEGDEVPLLRTKPL